MQYRDFGKTGLKVSALGFGMMRLPLYDGTQGSFDRDVTNLVDKETSIKMLRHAIDNGLNYVDTAYNYLNGTSEIITGEALKDGYREKVFLATKSPVWLYESEEDFDRLLDEQLAKLQTDHIDFYLLHSLHGERFDEKILKFNTIEKMKAAKAAGKIRYMGFSFHDNLDSFKRIVDAADWDFCQIQLNYVDVDYQAGIEGLEYAASKGLAVVIMEPLRGGSLVNVPAPVKAIFDKMGKTPVQAALDFLWDRPEVSLLLSGMGYQEQVEENMAYADASAVGKLSDEERAMMLQAKEERRKFFNIPCTACNYCNICPQQIAIPAIFKAMNRYGMGEESSGKKDYKAITEQGNVGDQCIGCKACEGICPQHIEISDWMPKIHKILG
jgi:predicted aldo/keto reductase-like oxidoreductase